MNNQIVILIPTSLPNSKSYEKRVKSIAPINQVKIVNAVARKPSGQKTMISVGPRLIYIPKEKEPKFFSADQGIQLLMAKFKDLKIENGNVVVQKKPDGSLRSQRYEVISSDGKMAKLRSLGPKKAILTRPRKLSNLHIARKK